MMEQNRKIDSHIPSHFSQVLIWYSAGPLSHIQQIAFCWNCSFIVALYVYMAIFNILDWVFLSLN